MDIESKRYRVRSAAGGGYWITEKRTGEVYLVAEMPGANALAMMHETAFDRLCADKIRDA